MVLNGRAFSHGVCTDTTLQCSVEKRDQAGHAGICCSSITYMFLVVIWDSMRLIYLLLYKFLVTADWTGRQDGRGRGRCIQLWYAAGMLNIPADCSTLASYPQPCAAGAVCQLPSALCLSCSPSLRSRWPKLACRPSVTSCQPPPDAITGPRQGKARQG